MAHSIQHLGHEFHRRFLLDQRIFGKSRDDISVSGEILRLLARGRNGHKHADVVAEEERMILATHAMRKLRAYEDSGKCLARYCDNMT